jgi:hypothetical protein
MSVKKINKLELVNRLIEKDYEKLESLKLDDITNFMLNYLKYENNELIRYVTEKKRFRYYQNGVWKDKNDLYIKKRIRKILLSIKLIHKKTININQNKLKLTLSFPKII